MSAAIEMKSLRKAFGDHVVLDSIDLSVPSGVIFALLGPNGAGKTTLIHILSTLVTPDEGTVHVAGHDIITDKEGVKRSISLTGQFAAVDEVLTADENLRMMGRLSGLTTAEARIRATELLESFDLTAAAHKRVKTYSGGMRRRLDLALSLVVSRPILFLDEPTMGLDTQSRRELWKNIRQLAAQGVTVFLTTQYLEEADQLADVIAVIAGGRVVAQGTTDQLKSRIGGEVVELRDENDEIIREIPTGGSIGEVKMTIDELARTAPDGSRVNIRRPSMDDVFIALTTKQMEGSII
ncbi:ATP-binding cassette domain-containing protein [Paenibacillus sp. GP183]|jgi:ABC-2 type transport system ATP-binding protein|uniref:ATP-binding cassette domain-containing protein n=1 Tax=Paenibacillus sp. GP183 TaxID=1882751 RepID=UPI000897AA74|nr:ATP-binding cassette domain-containing protein [Paenibacillus sp. GP183]SEC58387.1 ABC-2 type transport system ATP-binding protein [Paenibacillus sp. GP183]